MSRSDDGRLRDGGCELPFHVSLPTLETDDEGRGRTQRRKRKRTLTAEETGGAMNAASRAQPPGLPLELQGFSVLNSSGAGPSQSDPSLLPFPPHPAGANMTAKEIDDFVIVEAAQRLPPRDGTRGRGPAHGHAQDAPKVIGNGGIRPSVSQPSVVQEAMPLQYTETMGVDDATMASCTVAMCRPIVIVGSDGVVGEGELVRELPW